MEVMLVGDVHGQFDTMVNYQHAFDPDLTLQVGDLEPVRNADDCAELTGPDKYNKVKDFPAYWEGSKSIPSETVFIGGNHEPRKLLYDHDPNYGNSPYLIENLRYIGRFNIIQHNGLTIAGLTGNYSPKIYDWTQNKRLQYAKNRNWRKHKRIGYFTHDEVSQLINKAQEYEVDILLTHEWPEEKLFVDKPKSNRSFGVEPMTKLAKALNPTIYAAGHIHHHHKTELKNLKTTFVALDRLSDSNYGAIERLYITDDKNNLQTPSIY